MLVFLHEFCTYQCTQYIIMCLSVGHIFPLSCNLLGVRGHFLYLVTLVPGWPSKDKKYLKLGENWSSDYITLRKFHLTKTYVRYQPNSMKESWGYDLWGVSSLSSTHCPTLPLQTLAAHRTSILLVFYNMGMYKPQHSKFTKNIGCLTPIIYGTESEGEQ